jgi:hypothetical protein
MSLWAFELVRVKVNLRLLHALTAAQEAIKLYEPLAEQLPQQFVRYLLSAYRTLADVLDGLNRSDEAEAIRRRLERG